MDDATACAFSRGCCEVSGTAVRAVSGRLPHSGKYDFLNIVKTNVPLRFKENMINFYFDYKQHTGLWCIQA
jgi:trimethylamine:corrinoid methyltransferase-like protein